MNLGGQVNQGLPVQIPLQTTEPEYLEVGLGVILKWGEIAAEGGKLVGGGDEI